MAVCPLILKFLHISSQNGLFILIILASQTFYPNWPIFLHGYIRHIRDIFQLWDLAVEFFLKTHINEWGRQNQRTELCSSRNIFLINMRIKEAKIQFPQQDGWIELRQWQHRQWLFLGWDHFFPRVFPSLLSTWSKDCLKWTSKSIHSFKTRF